MAKRKQNRAKSEPPTKWTAPFAPYPVYDKDGNIVDREESNLTEEQKRAAIENADYFRGIQPRS